MKAREFLGPLLSVETAKGVDAGLLHPRTLQRFPGEFCSVPALYFHEFHQQCTCICCPACPLFCDSFTVDVCRVTRVSSERTMRGSARTRPFHRVEIEVTSLVIMMYRTVALTFHGVFA